MALKPTSISMLLLLTIFLAMGTEALATRAGPSKPAKVEEKPKRPDCFVDGGNMAIPGVGRVSTSGGGLGSVSDIIPSYGDAGVGFDRQYIPGGDDLPVPNPGYEVPIPSNP